MGRKLATIRKIRKIESIEGADRIELCFVDGWQSVIKKGEYKEGDLVIFIEIDSILPLREWSEFLQDKNHPEKPIRVKTCKLRGTLSQGIIIPLETITAELILVEGMDVTDLLEITKYEPPVSIHLQGVKLRDFPTHLFPKTDCERIQNLWSPEFTKKLFGCTLSATIKEDGTSLSVYRKDSHCGVCSRNMELNQTNDNNEYVKAFKKYDFENILNSNKNNIAVQCELVGPGIQKNNGGYSEQCIKIFDVFDIDEQRYYSPLELTCFCDAYGLPKVDTVKLFEFTSNTTMYDLLTITDQKYKNSRKQIEGIVFTTCDSRRIRFKYINPNYLLKNE